MSKLFYIPQRPYLPNGTLLDQVIYPDTEIKEGFTREDIINLLRDVQLGTLYLKDADGLDSENEWAEILSGGEKQRMAMARLFYHKPEFAILDECTSTISVEVEHMLYTKAKSLGITVFTISHRASLFKFHEHYLKFEGDGIYSFNELNVDDKMMNSQNSKDLLTFQSAKENKVISRVNKNFNKSMTDSQIIEEKKSENQQIDESEEEQDVTKVKTQSEMNS